jgi:hypothetical protein
MVRTGVLGILAGVALLAPLIAAPARADIIVLESDVAGLEPGQAYGDDTAIQLGDGQSLSLMLPSGETRKLDGPANLKVAEITKGIAVDPSVWSTVTGILQRGGSSEEEAGGVRGFGMDAGPAEFSWSVIPAVVAGDVCVEKDAVLSIARPPLGDVDGMTVADADGTRIPIRWPVDAETTAWPSQLPPVADKTYVFMVPSLPQQEVTLRYLEQPLPQESSLIPALLKHGCKFQVESWLNSKLFGAME